jgi:hypothetical protein
MKAHSRGIETRGKGEKAVWNLAFGMLSDMGKFDVGPMGVFAIPMQDKAPPRTLPICSSPPFSLQTRGYCCRTNSGASNRQPAHCCTTRLCAKEQTEAAQVDCEYTLTTQNVLSTRNRFTTCQSCLQTADRPHHRQGSIHPQQCHHKRSHHRRPSRAREVLQRDHQQPRRHRPPNPLRQPIHLGTRAPLRRRRTASVSRNGKVYGRKGQAAPPGPHPLPPPSPHSDTNNHAGQNTPQRLPTPLPRLANLPSRAQATLGPSFHTHRRRRARRPASS